MTVLSYSPSHVAPETLELLTTGASRQRLLETLVEAVRSEVGRPAHQHHLLIGARGSGKTHTLTLVAHRLRTDPQLADRTLPLVLAEEEVARHPADLLIKVLTKLAAVLETLEAPGVMAARKETRAVLAALRSEGDDERALETAMGGLEAASAALDRLLVVVVENLHLLLYAGPGLSRRSVEPGQWALRRLLLPARGLLLLAGAPSLFGEVCDRRAPFFDFFRIHHLEELPPEEMLGLIRTRLDLELQRDRLDPAQHARLAALAEGFAERTPKLRGLLPLTGGLPRFAHLLFDLLAETEMQESVDLLSRFLDEQTPYFQARLDPRLVPEVELEILDLLATAPGPQTVTDLANSLRAKAPNAVATYLKRLQERGLVRQVGNAGRKVLYDVAEPLFRVWRRFRLGRAEREQIALLAELVAALFEPREIDDERRMLVGMGHAAFRLRVLDAAWEWHARQAQAAQPAGFYGALTAEEDALDEEAEKEYMTGSLQRAYELFGRLVERLRQRNAEGLARALARFSDIALLNGRIQEALVAAEEGETLARKAGDHLGRADAITSRADGLLRLGDNQAAIEALREAESLFLYVGDDLGRANAITSRAEVLFQLGDNQAALEALREAESLFSNVGSDLGRANAIRGRADGLFLLGDSEAAFSGYQEAQVLYEEGGDELGLGGCHRGLGQLAVARDQWEEGIDHLITAWRFARKTGSRRNTDLVRRDIWRVLRLAGHQLEASRFQDLLRRTEPLVHEAEEEETARTELVQFVVDVLARLGPERLLDVLPILEAGLQDPQRSLLRPIRLVAEVQAGRRAEELPEEPDEMRRAVREVMAAVERARPLQAGTA